MTIINDHGKDIDFELAVNYMDDGIREELHRKLAPCTDQEFFEKYAEAHKQKFNEIWIANTANPKW